jgi:flagellar biosynthetic protein FliQ
MTPESVLTLGQQALEVALLVCAPLLGSALVTGLVVSILQAATQINEATLSFIPKLVALVVTLVIAGPWMLALLTAYLQRVLGSIPQVIG